MSSEENNTTMNKTQNTRKIVIFLIIVFGLSGIVYGLIVASGGRDATGPLGILLNWAPAIAAIITALITQRNLRGFGWGWGQSRYHLLAWAVPIGVFTLTYAVIWLTGLGGFYDEAHVAQVAGEMGLVGQSPYLVMLLQLVAGFSITFIVNAIFNMGEEIGWRGWLVPKLDNRYTFTYTALISGIIWVIYHYPLLLFLGEAKSNIPIWYQLLNITIQGIAISLIVAWLRLKSGSLWPALWLHANTNAMLQGVFEPLTYDTGLTAYISDWTGVGLTVAWVIVAYLFWRKRDSLPETGIHT
jgi:membrane protease YdiL (CAAX protease family)